MDTWTTDPSPQAQQNALPTAWSRRRAHATRSAEVVVSRKVYRGRTMLFLVVSLAVRHRTTEDEAGKERVTVDTTGIISPHLPTPSSRGRGFCIPSLVPIYRGGEQVAKQTQPSRLPRRAPCKTRTRQPGRGEAKKANATPRTKNEAWR